MYNVTNVMLVRYLHNGVCIPDWIQNMIFNSSLGKTFLFSFIQSLKTIEINILFERKDPEGFPLSSGISQVSNKTKRNERLYSFYFSPESVFFTASLFNLFPSFRSIICCCYVLIFFYLCRCGYGNLLHFVA